MSQITDEFPATRRQRDLPPIRTGRWGVDADAADLRTDPGEDFFRHCNGRWIDSNPIPDGLSSLDQFTLLARSTALRLRAMIEDMAASTRADAGQRRIVDAYAAFMDDEAIERAGIGPARAALAAITRAATLSELLAISTDPAMPSLLAVGVGVDPKDPAEHLLSLAPAQPGLPSPELYWASGEPEEAIRSAYREYLAFLLGKAGERAFAPAEELFEFERKMAALHWPRRMLRDPDLACRKLGLADVAALAPAFPLPHVLPRSVRTRADVVLAHQTLLPSDGAAPELAEAGLPAMMRLIAGTRLRVVKAFLAVHFLDRHAAVLGREMEEARFAVFDRLIRGRLQQRPRWERAIEAVERQMPDLLGSEYAGRHFSPEAKAQVQQIVECVLNAMRERLAAAPGLTEQTRRAALAKLAALDVQVGWSISPQRYDGLAISPTDPLENAMAAARWREEDALARLGMPVDRTRWPFPAHTVNASYREERNQIILPAGILQPPFFDPAADPAVNFGAVGAIIGHEISHGFDDKGSKYDAAGALRNWWHPVERQAFERATRPLVEQFGAFCPLDDGRTCIDGQLTLGENVSDLLGLQLAHRAYRLFLAGHDGPVLDGTTGEQRFFLSFAQMWRGVQRVEALREQLRRGPHSPAPYRVNGTVRNVGAWYDAFGISQADELYLPPKERVRIW